MLSSSTKMDDHPVLSTQIDSHTNDGVDDGSTLSSKIASNRSVVNKPNQK